LIFWIMPRGLITVVLAIEVAGERGDGLAFVPGLAFAVILITNALLVLASFRARRSAPVAAVAVTEISVDVVRTAVAPAHSCWLLGLWYGNHSEQLHLKGIAEWIRVHLHREN
jgi:hypothetical protein